MNSAPRTETRARWLDGCVYKRQIAPRRPNTLDNNTLGDIGPLHGSSAADIAITHPATVVS